MLASLALSCAAGDASLAWPARPSVQLDVRDGETLGEDDIDTIVELAGAAGVGPIETIFAGLVARAGDCSGVIVAEARACLDETHVRWKELQLRREESPCPLLNEPGEGPILALRGWRTSTRTITEHELRRVHVGDAHVDVSLGDGVPWDAATRLVSSLKLHQVRATESLSDIDLDSTVFVLGPIRAPDRAPLPPRGEAEHSVFQITARGRGGWWSLALCLEPDGVILVTRTPVPAGRA
ncbi:MAG TPA: hypothetical protein VK824_06250 [Planctomycetota bacterium]|nr:hypothetical protein [Planctomycetota bacterium]